MNGTAAMLGPLVAVVPLIVIWVYSLADFARTDERDMRTFPRTTWVLILVLFNVFGALMWLRLGRPQRPARR